MLDRLKAYREKLRHSRAPEVLHEGHGFAHLVYCVAVFFEGHGLYALMGGILALFTLALLFSGGEDVA